MTLREQSDLGLIMYYNITATKTKEHSQDTLIRVIPEAQGPTMAAISGFTKLREPPPTTLISAHLDQAQDWPIARFLIRGEKKKRRFFCGHSRKRPNRSPCNMVPSAPQHCCETSPKLALFVCFTLRSRRVHVAFTSGLSVSL